MTRWLVSQQLHMEMIVLSHQGQSSCSLTHIGRDTRFTAGLMELLENKILRIYTPIRQHFPCCTITSTTSEVYRQHLTKKKRKGCTVSSSSHNTDMNIAGSLAMLGNGIDKPTICCVLKEVVQSSNFVVCNVGTTHYCRV